MVNLIRKHQQTLMIFLTIFIIIAFVWFWNGSQSTHMDRAGSDTIAMIYGRRISEPEAQREARKYYVALELGLIELVQDLAGFSRGQVLDNFVWNSMVLRREADRLEIEPSEEEIRTTLASLRPLQTDGQFDSTKLGELIQRSLTPRGFTETVIDDLVRDELRLQKVKALIGASVELSPAEFKSNYEVQQEKVEVSVIRLRSADLSTGVKITDEEAKQSFDQRKDQFKSDEKRSIDYVNFDLTEEQKKLTGKERNEALRALAMRAEEFTQATLEKGAKFDEVAKKFSVPVQAANEFSEEQPDPRFAKIPAVTTATFQLDPAEPNSDVIQGENGFYVLHLRDVQPSRALTFEEAKPKVIEQLTQQRVAELLNLKAGEVRKTILAELAAGKTFAEAAKTAGQPFEALPPFSIAEPGKVETADQQQIMEKALELGEKQLSECIPTDDGGLLVYLAKRQPMDPEKFARDRATLEPLFAKQKREKAFLEWLRVRRDAAKLQFVQR